MQTLTLTTPDDFHLHVRDHEALPHTVAATARCFARALVMPNLTPPVTRLEHALAYRERILAACPPGTAFTPLMSLYLTDQTPVDEVDRAVDSQLVHAIKLYPSGATTHSDAGVTHLDRVMPVLERMAIRQLPLLIHGEVTDPDVDIFDREAVFIDKVLTPLRQRLPELPLVLEHITTRQAVEFIREQTGRVAATLTAHHLQFNRNAMLVGGVRPHYYCLPVLKRKEHQQALLQAATSGDPHFFLGTDSAPHAQSAKESACGCAGAYTAPTALERYAQIFDEQGALNKLEGFASHFGADFYRLPHSTSQVTLVRSPWTVPASLPYPGGAIIPLGAGSTLTWKLAHD
ncbi:MAG: dihydroorotase [Pseudomonadales bacterium]|nr:dihydroorotase [Pseudomonadales bacterium]